MLALIRLAVVAIALLMIAEFAIAGDGAAASVSPEGVNSVSLDTTPLILAQSSDSSSSGSFYIPRSLIRLAVFGVIGLFSAAAAAVRKMSGS